MSSQHEEIIKCSSCKSNERFTVWDSINVTVDPDLKQPLLDGKLTTFCCRRCGNTAGVDYDCLYHDMEKSLAIWLRHNASQHPIQFDQATKTLLSIFDQSYTCRVVTSYHELLDKIRVFDDGLRDDGVELFKLLICIREGIDLSCPFYFAGIHSSWFKGKSLMFLLATEQGFSERRYPLQRYEEVVDQLLSDISPLLCQADNKWPKVDRELLLSACEKVGLLQRATKPRKSELEAAAEFVLSIAQRSQAQWPSICKSLESFDAQFKSLRDDKIASYEFMLAAVAIQLHAVLNLLSAEQATRIRSHILECLTTDDVGNYPTAAINEYDSAWDASLQSAEPPHIGIASVLYDKLDLSSAVSIGNSTVKSPMLMMALGGTALEFCGAWWKDYIERHQIIST